MRKLLYAAAAATALISTAAMATVTFDPTSDTGFVGKGDVQLAFGWNNATAQAQAGNLSFEYDTVTMYDVTCQFDAGPTVHTITVESHSDVSDTVQYDARSHNQVDGFYLTGNTDTSTDGTVPVVGEGCPGNSALGAVTGVTQDGGSSGGLYVSDAALGLGPDLIWSPPS